MSNKHDERLFPPAAPLERSQSYGSVSGPDSPAEQDSDPVNEYAKHPTDRFTDQFTGRLLERCPEWLLEWYHRYRGILILVAAHVCFATMGLFAKLLEEPGPNSRRVHPLELVFIRMFITLVFSITYICWKMSPRDIIGPKDTRLLLLSRGICGFFGLSSAYFTLWYLDLATTTVILFLTPVMTGMMASFSLGEPFGRIERYAGAVALLGIVFIAKPTSLLDAPGEQGSANQSTGLQRFMAVCIALFSVVLASGANISIRAIGNRAHAIISVTAFSICSCLGALLGGILFPVPFFWPSYFTTWIMLFGTGFFGFFGQLCLSLGLQLEEASRATSIQYIQAVFAFTFEALIWHHAPDVWSLVGIAIILASVITVAAHKHWNSPPESDAPPSDDLEDGQSREELLSPSQR